MQRIRDIESIHKERLSEVSKHPLVGEVRWLGSVGVLELRADDPGYFSNIRDRLYAFFLNRGILLRPLGNTIYVMPPYVISAPDMHRIYDAVSAALLEFKQ
jgi:adenosylmethionine-8-amino-7-oxononanoate aminotransferase